MNFLNNTFGLTNVQDNEQKIDMLATNINKKNEAYEKQYNFITNLVNALAMSEQLPAPVGEPQAHSPGDMAEAGTLRHSSDQM